MSEAENKEYINLKNEVEKIVRKCVADIVIDEDKIHYREYTTNESVLDLRYGSYVICVIRLDSSTNTLKTIAVMDASRKDKNGRSKVIEKPLKNVAEIEDYKALMLAHLKHYDCIKGVI